MIRSFFHWLDYGHWYNPLYVGTSIWGIEIYACNTCKWIDPEAFAEDLHSRGACHKALLGYRCKGLPGECDQ